MIQKTDHRHCMGCEHAAEAMRHSDPREWLAARCFRENGPSQDWTNCPEPAKESWREYADQCIAAMKALFA